MMPNGVGRTAMLAGLVAAALLSTAAVAEEGARAKGPGAYSYGPLPKTFDPVSASAAEIARYGLPARPDKKTNPQGYAGWLTDVSPDIKRIKIEIPTLAAVRRGNKSPSTNWSGVVFTREDISQYGAKSFASVHAAWSLPNVKMPAGVCNKDKNTPEGAYQASVWPGIGGDSEQFKGLIQAGTDSSAQCVRGRSKTQNWLWYEFYPLTSQPISELPVEPGDVVSVYVWAVSGAEAHAHIVNRSLRRSVSLRFHQPKGTPLVGESLEWIIERPTYDGALTNLADYTEATVYEAWGTTAAGKLIVPATDGTGKIDKRVVVMIDDDGEKLSIPKIIGSEAIHFHNTGPSK